LLEPITKGITGQKFAKFVGSRAPFTPFHWFAHTPFFVYFTRHLYSVIFYTKESTSNSKLKVFRVSGQEIKSVFDCFPTQILEQFIFTAGTTRVIHP
jgi:hypothetical protein